MKPLNQNQEPKKVGRCTESFMCPTLPASSLQAPATCKHTSTHPCLAGCLSKLNFKELAKKSQVEIYPIKTWAHTLNHYPLMHFCPPTREKELGRWQREEGVDGKWSLCFNWLLLRTLEGCLKENDYGQSAGEVIRGVQQTEFMMWLSNPSPGYHSYVHAHT